MQRSTCFPHSMFYGDQLNPCQAILILVLLRFRNVQMVFSRGINALIRSSQKSSLRPSCVVVQHAPKSTDIVCGSARSHGLTSVMSSIAGTLHYFSIWLLNLVAICDCYNFMSDAITITEKAWWCSGSAHSGHMGIDPGSARYVRETRSASLSCQFQFSPFESQQE